MWTSAGKTRSRAWKIICSMDWWTEVLLAAQPLAAATAVRKKKNRREIRIIRTEQNLH